jgi:hypothetical protein
MVYVDQAGGGSGQAGALQVTAKSGNQLTLLNPPATVIPVRTYPASGLAPGINQRLQIHDNFSYKINNFGGSGQVSLWPMPWYLNSDTGGGIDGANNPGYGQDIYNRTYGAWDLYTVATASKVAVLTPGPTNGTAPLLLAGLGALDLYFRFCFFSHIPAATNPFSFYFGLTDNYLNPNNAVALSATYQSSLGSAAWGGFATNAGVTTYGSYSATPTIKTFSSTALTYYTVHISINATWTEADFYVNDTLVSKVTSNLPVSATALYSWIYLLSGAAITAEIFLDDFFLDYQYATI